ncbi:MAG TPA: hypothetical protein VNZ57_13920 [Longimicrobiales bacterium]|nr:hypothetical protein [Longimicrobiales bacterium]
MVHFRCKSCGDEHPASIPFAEKLYFDAAVTLEFQLECSRTGQIDVYNKTDLTWRETGLQSAVRT